MDKKTQSLALCGVVGGAGTTRLTLEQRGSPEPTNHDGIVRTTDVSERLAGRSRVGDDEEHTTRFRNIDC